MIELQEVSKRFDGAVAVDAIDLTINTGELCVLVGTSGCGKSTTLRMINRLIPHSSGEIRIDGTAVTDLDAVQLRRRIGYAIQSTGLFPHWTVAQNIGLVPSLLGWPKTRIQARVDELLVLLGLDRQEFAPKYPHQLSGGQAQRVGVARALAGDPDILLMDEPFGALDPITRENLQDELLRIQQQVRKTIVFVTHDIDEALKLADRLVIMDQGRIVQQGKPWYVLEQPANSFVENLLGKADRGLKQASLTAVSALMDAVDEQSQDSNVPRIEATATLKQAMSAMLWHRTDRLCVVDKQHQPVGQLRLDRMLRPKEL
ncbi:ABC transporter ATP-binding protein [Salinispirillum sp. LH 10-3-1]|uniref:ABC transporter ATP-binding protein n=1 Tax=Salinispirillum sp. LH 10-3-1 TaxID=2952525 RepID=A0AB38YH62_9GAMM